MQILFATTNPHKIDEVTAVLEPLGIDVIGLDALETIPEEPPEDGGDFASNARFKAVAYATATGRICLADDSGLEVDALGGEPGVHSARYAGIGDTRLERDTANNERLLRELRGVPKEKRTARFVCAMCVADSSGAVLAESQGTYEGVVAESPRGDNGFGYDPLLELPDLGLTSAELSSDEKNRRSHRGQAIRRLAASLDAICRE